MLLRKFNKESKLMAGPTRLELATSGVTGRRSNQLNYDPAKGETNYRTKARQPSMFARIQSPIQSYSGSSTGCTIFVVAWMIGRIEQGDPRMSQAIELEIVYCTT